MKSNRLDLNEGKVLKLIFKLGVPAVITALFDEINAVIDTIFMGQYLGAEAVASMSVVLPFLVFASALSFLFSEGASVSMGRYLGAKDYDNSSQIASLTVKITLITSVILGLVSFFMSKHVTTLFKLDAQTAIYAVKYVKYFSLGLPIFMGTMLLLKFLYTEGHSKKTLQLTILQVALNILLNFIFLGVFKWGVEGAVAATLLSFLIQGAFAAKALIKHSNHIKISNEKFNIGYFKEVIPLGMSSFFTMILLAVTISIQSKVISDYGPSALGVLTIFENMFSIFSSFATGIMNASLVLLAYSAGAKNKKRFVKILKTSAGIIFVSSVIINLPLVFAPDFIGSFFTDSAEIIKLLATPILILGLTSPFIFTTNTMLFAMQPIGMEKTATLVFALQQLVLFVPLIILLKDISFNYAMIAQPGSEVIGGIITLSLLPKFIKMLNGYFKPEDSILDT